MISSWNILKLTDNKVTNDQSDEFDTSGALIEPAIIVVVYSHNRERSQRKNPLTLLFKGFSN